MEKCGTCHWWRHFRWNLNSGTCYVRHGREVCPVRANDDSCSLHRLGNPVSDKQLNGENQVTEMNWSIDLSDVRRGLLDTQEMREKLNPEEARAMTNCSLQLAIAERLETVSGSLIEMTKILYAIRDGK